MGFINWTSNLFYIKFKFIYIKKISFLKVVDKILQNLYLKRKITVGIFFIFSLFGAFIEVAQANSCIKSIKIIIKR